MQVGGDFPRTMFDLYDFMRNQLRTANMRKEAAPITVVMDLLGEIRHAWATMMVQSENQVPSTQSWVATAA
jgi:flagellin-specific chaperone FliS